jgi:hypothetical protein
MDHRIDRLRLITLCFSGLAFLAMLLCMPARAQTGQITGRVTDQHGSVLPNVGVTVVETSTTEQRTVQTNSDGYYTVPSLAPGPYSISLASQGFKSFSRTGLQLEVGQDLRVDVAMELGSVTEQVVVTGQAPLLETETSSTGQVISGSNVVQLPLLGRDAYALGELVPGVRGSIGMNTLPVDIITTASISINGAPATENDFLLDGAPNSIPAANQPGFYPIADSVEEFRVQTNNYSAEFGRASGGIYNVVTKGGTNDLHFSVYEFYRNKELTSNNWFSKAAGQATPPLTFNQYGGVLGGPLVIPKLYNGHNKTFFFIGSEIVRYQQGNTYTATVPNPAELSGNFSGDTNSAGGQITIYNPFSTRLNSAGTGYIRDPFPGNVIPAALINPIAKNMAAYFPAPTIPNAATGKSNYIVTDANNIQKNQFTVRIDQNFTTNTRMFVRYSYDDSPYIRPSPYGASNPGSPGYGAQDFFRQNAAVEGDHVFSPTLIGVVRASFARTTNKRGPVSLGFDIASLGFPAGLAQQIGSPAAFPVETITGYSVASSVANESGAYSLGETGLLRLYFNNYALLANVTKTFGAHELIMGTDSRVIQANILQTGDNSNNYAFTSAFTQGPTATQASSTAGDALASFLLGTPATASVTPSPAMALQTKYYSGFVQDNWKVRSRLTLNLGVRYEYETPRTDRYNRLTNFDYNAPVPLAVSGLNLHGALSFPGAGGNSRYQSNPYYDHISPRLGFAWQANPNTVIRGGGGLFYSDLWGIGSSPTSFGISGFTTATSMVTSINGVTPTNTLSNPYPTGLNVASGSSLGAATLLGQAVTFYNRAQKTPSTIQWNFGIQQLFPHSVALDLAYVGTHSLYEPLNKTLDQLPDADLALGNALLTTVPNPFHGQILTGALSGATVAQEALLTPYPQFTAVTANSADWAEGRYNALEAKVEKRLSSGFNLLVAYTWSKMLDQGAGSFSGETDSGGGIQDYNNLKAELSPSTIDQTHRVVFGTLYQLPFFTARRGFAGHTLGGWEISALGSFVSGSPLGIASATNTTFSLGGGQRPNWNGLNPAISHPTVSHWFNTSDFSAPPAFTFGNTPRTFNFVRSDWIRNIDLSVHKNTRITERLNLQLRADAFNMDNTPTFQPPNTSYGSAQFGSVTAQQNTPRSIQLAVKLLY